MTKYEDLPEVPSISILTPVYNQERFIAETIESVLSQKYANLEYLVIDDGSTDNTLETIKGFDNKLKWQTQTNMGETATVNKGVSLLTGEIVGIINGDDPLLPGAVEAVAQCFLDRPELVAVYPDWTMIDANGQLLSEMKTKDYDYAKMVRGHDCLPGPGCFFKRDIFLKLNGRDPSFRYTADYEFWLRAGLEGPFARIPQTLASFRWYNEGTSLSARGECMAAEHIRLVDKTFALPNFPVRLNKYKNEAYSSAYFYAGACCGENSKLKKDYFTKALKKSPGIYLWKYRSHTLEMIRFFSPVIYRILKQVLKKLRSIK